VFQGTEQIAPRHLFYIVKQLETQSQIAALTCEIRAIRLDLRLDLFY